MKRDNERYVQARPQTLGTWCADTHTHRHTDTHTLTHTHTCDGVAQMGGHGALTTGFCFVSLSVRFDDGVFKAGFKALKLKKADLKAALMHTHSLSL